MAFMMPVVKNDYEIYKSNKPNRNRRVSECSNPTACARNRKISECSKSDGPSFGTSPGSDTVLGSPAHRSVPISISSRYGNNNHHSHSFHHHQQFNHSHVHFGSHHSHTPQSKNSSRTSQSSLQSPSKSDSSSPPKSNSNSSLSLFHNKLVDKLKKSLKSKNSVNNEVLTLFLYDGIVNIKLVSLSTPNINFSK